MMDSKVLLKLIWSILLFLKKTQATLHRPAQYSLRGVRAVNGSDPYGGCPQDAVRIADAERDFLTNLYCATSKGVITDGATTIGDTSQPGWASGLLTINRNTQDAVILALKFQSEITPRKVQLSLFYCPSWNIIASTAHLYSFHSPTERALTASIDIKIFSDRPCGIQTYELPVLEVKRATNDFFYIEFSFDTVNQQWVHIAEVVFVDTETIELQPSHTQPITTANASPLRTPSVTPNTMSKTVTTVSKYLKTTASSTASTRNTTWTSLNSSFLPNSDSSVNTTIVASAIGCTIAVLLLIAFTLVSVSIVFRKTRKSRQSCSSEQHVSHMSKRGFTIDSKLDHEAVDEAYGAKSDLNLTAYAHNVAYVCDVSRDSEHLYQEIPFRCNERPFDSNKDMVMVQNVAYTVANREVIYVDNVAYARATSQQHKI